MLSTLCNAWKVPELKKRFTWATFLVAIFRIGTHAPVPGISTNVLRDLANSGIIFGFYGLLSDGAFRQSSIFALSMTPCINALIIVQLLTIVILSLERLSRERGEGRKKMQEITRISSIVIGLILTFGTYSMATAKGATVGMQWIEVLVVLVTLVASSAFCTWLGDQITAKGFGNGMSILIFVDIISQLPMTLVSLFTLRNQGKIIIIEILLFVVFAIVLLGVVIFFSLAKRETPIQYAGKAVGNKAMRKQNTHIPLGIIGSTVITIISVMSVMMFPRIIAEFFPNYDQAIWIADNKYSILSERTWMYPVVYSVLAIFFTQFYTQIIFKPGKMAENLHKSAGFVSGIRPGDAAEKYFEKVLTKVSLVGGVSAALLAILPILISDTQLQGIQFGSTSLLIMVGVGLDFSRQLSSQLVMRRYQGLLK